MDQEFTTMPCEDCGEPVKFPAGLEQSFNSAQCGDCMPEVEWECDGELIFED